MKHFFCICLIVCFFAGCSPSVNYLGKSYVPTSNVEIFLDRMDILRSYETMGVAEVALYGGFSMQAGQVKLEKYAREKGADAIIFDGINSTVNPSVTVTEDNQKNDKGGYTVVSTTSTNNQVTQVIRATLIKYK